MDSLGGKRRGHECAQRQILEHSLSLLSHSDLFLFTQISYFESRVHNLFLLYRTMLASDVSESKICESRIPFKAIRSRALTDAGKLLMTLLRYMMKLARQF